LPDRCKGCAESRARPFLDLGELPLAGGFLKGPEEIPGERRYQLVVSVCDNCGLVQIVEPVDPDVLFQDYSFATGTIPALVTHFDAYAGWLCERFNPQTVVEFGCNDGTLLAALEKRRVRSVGVDISANITEMARERGLTVLTGTFGMQIVDELKEQAGPVDLVTGSNVFAHNADPDDILGAAAEILGPSGVLSLEVMYAGDLRDQLQWDTLYHEHLTFYSLATLAKLLRRFDFDVVDAERVPMHGGSLRLAARRAGHDGARSRGVDEILAWEEETKLNEPATWDGFAAESRRRIDVFGTTMARLAKDATIWAYGAAGKATMWVNACEMDYLEAVVDASPLRYGKLMPGTHTPIVSPDEFRNHEPEYVFASAWNYLDNIVANESWYKGAWVVPLPELRIR
jgi:C-methyltransferase